MWTHSCPLEPVRIHLVICAFMRGLPVSNHAGISAMVLDVRKMFAICTSGITPGQDVHCCMSSFALTWPCKGTWIEVSYGFPSLVNTPI